MGKISSRPMSISAVSTNLLKSENWEKLPTGPTISSPGPMLLRQEATALMVVVMEKLSTEMNNMENPKIRK